MADGKNIKLTIDGLPEDSGQVRLTVFLSELQRLYSLLGKYDSMVSGGERANDFRIVGLSYSSPAEVCVAPAPIKDRPLTAELLVERFLKDIDDVGKGIIPANLEPTILEEMRDLAKPIEGKKVSYVAISGDGLTVELNREFGSRIDLALAEEEECVGTIEGKLEQINLHGGANNFRIFPIIGPAKVTCHFPIDMVDKAIDAVNREVCVTGLMKYKPNSYHPYYIEVANIDIYPPEDELPTFDDLKGIAPDATGETMSEYFVRELRDGWDE